MPKKYLIANWKMELSQENTKKLSNLLSLKITQSDTEMIVCPSFLFLSNTKQELSNSPIKLGAQDVHTAENGKFTGEISAKMLEDVGCEYCIVGHSERRHQFDESDTTIAKKVKKLIEHDISPILCIGESQEQRDNGSYLQSLRAQLISSLASIHTKEVSKIIIAYEPIWAIGTGNTASSEQISEVHNFIRTIVKDEYQEEGKNISILYGGSVSEKNASEIFAIENVDGGLVGGKSLDANSFIRIFEAF